MEKDDFFLIAHSASPDGKMFQKWMEHIKSRFQSDDGNLQLGKTLDYLWGQIAKNTDNHHIVAAYNRFVTHCIQKGVPENLLDEAAHQSCEAVILDHCVNDLAKTDNLLSLLKQGAAFRASITVPKT